MKLIIVLLFSFLMAILITYELIRPLDFGTYNQETIIENNNKQYIFVARKWGLAGNHEQIELITPTQDTCIFYTDRLLYKNTSQGIIIIPPSEGVYIDDDIIGICNNDSSIIIKTINNPDSTNYLYDNYKKLGYEIIEIKINNHELSSIK